MVAASKMRKTQERMRASKPYANKIYDVVKHVARANSEYQTSIYDTRAKLNAWVLLWLLLIEVYVAV